MANDDGPKSHNPRDDKPRRISYRDNGVNIPTTHGREGWNGVDQREYQPWKNPTEARVYIQDKEDEASRLREWIEYHRERERLLDDAAQWLSGWHRWKRRWASSSIWVISLVATATVTCWISTGDLPLGLRVALHWMLIWLHNHTQGEYGL